MFTICLVNVQYNTHNKQCTCIWGQRGLKVAYSVITCLLLLANVYIYLFAIAPVLSFCMRIPVSPCHVIMTLNRALNGVERTANPLLKELC